MYSKHFLKDSVRDLDFFSIWKTNWNLKMSMWDINHLVSSMRCHCCAIWAFKCKTTDSLYDEILWLNYCDQTITWLKNSKFPPFDLKNTNMDSMFGWKGRLLQWKRQHCSVLKWLFHSPLLHSRCVPSFGWFSRWSVRLTGRRRLWGHVPRGLGSGDISRVYACDGWDGVWEHCGRFAC